MATFVILIAGASHPAAADLYAVSGATRSDLLHYGSDGHKIGRVVVLGESLGSLVRGPDSNLYVLGNTLGYGELSRINPITGDAEGLLRQPGQPLDITGVTLPSGIVFDASGRIYLGSTRFFPVSGITAVMRYDAAAHNVTPFAIPANQDDSITPRGFDADGNLLVSQSGGIARYDGVTGQYLGQVDPAPVFGETGPDGDLYVGTSNQGILRYTPGGVLIDTFVPPGRGGLADVTDLSFGNDGMLYVNSMGIFSVLRFQADTGAYVDTFRVYGTENEYLWEIQAINVPEPALLGVSSLLLTCISKRSRSRALQ